MITDKTKQAIDEEAFEKAVDYTPWDETLPPQDYFQEGFRQGAMWATDKMAKAILKAVNK